MNQQQWEALCDGCGKCCFRKFIEGRGKNTKLYFTSIACDQLDLCTGRCSNYKNRFKYNKECMHDVLSIGIPSTGSRLIGTISSFLEPITLTYGLTLVGYSSKFITLEYGIINGYVLPLILLPSFFSYAISNALLPVVSNSFANNNITYAKSKIKQAIFFSLLIGLPVTLIFIFIPHTVISFLLTVPVYSVIHS